MKGIVLSETCQAQVLFFLSPMFCISQITFYLFVLHWTLLGTGHILPDLDPLERETQHEEYLFWALLETPHCSDPHASGSHFPFCLDFTLVKSFICLGAFNATQLFETLGVLFIYIQNLDI